MPRWFGAPAAAMRLACLVVVLQAVAFGQIPSSVSLTASPNPANYGQAVTLTATVTAGATGKVTFYDGVTILGVAPISGNQATLTTIMLPSGKRSLRAYYRGQSPYLASTSAAVPETVVAGQSLGLRYLTTYAPTVALRSVTVGDFNADGKLDFASYTTSGASPVQVYLGNGDGTFRAAVSYALSFIPSSIVTADFDGDGNLDLAVSANGYLLNVFKGNGDGTFQAAVAATTSAYAYYSLTVADFNGDGIADLGGEVSYNGQMLVLIGNGDGTFKAPAIYSTGVQVQYLAAGDFNGDGIADLALGSYANGIYIFLGKGDGTFATPTSSAAVNALHAIAVSDFNGDGKADIAAAGYSSDVVDVFLGTGTGGFSGPATYGPSTNFYAIVIEDFNGDGMEDIGLTNSTGPIAVLMGNGDGTFQALKQYAGPYAVYGAAGDFNGDGKVDLLLTELSNAGYGVMLGGAIPDLTVSAWHDGGFTQGQTGADYVLTVGNIGDLTTTSEVEVTASLPSVFTATAIGGNGWTCSLATLACSRSDSLAPGASYPPIVLKLNVAGQTGDVTATFTVSGGGDQNLVNNTTGDTAFVRYATTASLGSSPNPATLGAAVTLTATVTAGATGNVSFYNDATFVGDARLSGGQAVFNTSALPSGALSLRAIYAGDASYGPSASATMTQTVNALSNNGVQPYRSYKVDNDPIWIVTGDFNGDGKTDLVTANQGSNSAGSISILVANGDGTFRPAANFSQGNSYPSGWGVAGDFNNDGKLDLAMAGDYGISIMPGNGDGTFGTTLPVRAVSFTYSWDRLFAADLNSDGNLDLVGMNDGVVHVFLGNGDGTFQPGSAIASTGLSNSNLAVADLNHDGRTDIVLFSAGGSTISILLGAGDGTFKAPLNATVASCCATGMAVADFNGDGRADVALWYGSQVDTFLGNGDGTLQSATSSTLNYFSYAGAVIVAADFNGDGKADLAIGDLNQIVVAFGKGDGTFQPTVASISTESPVSGIAVGDFNGDGHADFAAIGSYSYTSSVDVFLGGQFSGLSVTSWHRTNFTAGQTGSYQITVSNPMFTGQGSVTVTDSLPAGLTATAITGAGSNWTCTLSTLSCTTTGSEPTDVIYPPITVTVSVANLSPTTLNNQVSVSNGSKVSVATDATRIVSPTSTTLSVSPSPAALGQPVTLTAAVSGGATGMVEFTSDGLPVSTAALVAGQASVSTLLLNSGTHSLTALYFGDTTHAASISTPKVETVNAGETSGLAEGGSYATGTYPRMIAAADLNGDGKTDLVTASGASATVSVLLGDRTGGFGVNTDYAVGGTPVALSTGDFNNDGKTDIAVEVQSPGSSAILLGNGDGTFHAVPYLTTGAWPCGMAVGDFDEDGRADLLVGCVSIKNFTYTGVYLGNGDGTFQTPPSFMSTSSWAPLIVTDFNGDGKADLVFSGYAYVALGNGDGTFQDAILNSQSGTWLATGDLDGDGKADVVVSDGSAVQTLLGKGDGTFQNHGKYPTPGQSGAVVLADVNGDGKLDAVAAGATYFLLTNTLYILPGSGDGAFQQGVTYSLSRNIGSGQGGIATGDFNGDGRTDIALVNPQDASITVLLGVYPPSLSVTSSHLGRFVLGETGAAYTITVTNAGPGPTVGTVTVADALPAGLAATAISGSGWSCSLAALTCERSDALAAASSYPAITLTVSVTASSPGSVTNHVSVLGGGSPAAAGNDLTSIDATYSYLAGDVAPYTSAIAPNFGDGVLDIRDLIQELFAVNSIPGFVPAACSDRLDAIDVYPPDTATARGGDGVLDIRDLILELFRSNNLDTSRPVRTSLRGTCGGGSSGNSIGPTATERRLTARPPSQIPAAGAVALGNPEPFGAGEERVPVYLEAKRDLMRVAVTFGLGDQQSELRFAQTPDTPPSLTHDSQLGVVTAAWLNGVSVRAGERLILGYITGPAGFSPKLKVFGFSASGVDDNREVALDGPSTGGLGR